MLRCSGCVTVAVQGGLASCAEEMLSAPFGRGSRRAVAGGAEAVSALPRARRIQKYSAMVRAVTRGYLEGVPAATERQLLTSWWAR